MYRYFKALALPFVASFFLSIYVFGCSCAPEPYRPGITLDQIRKERREYFINEFAGAAFIGKIVKRERVNVNWIARTMAGEPAISQMYRYTIRVREYWLGVKSPTIIVYGEPVEEIYGNSRSGSSCGFKLDQGKTYFFTPSLYENNLTIDQCDFAGGGSAPKEGRANEFRKIMGEPQRF